MNECADRREGYENVMNVIKEYEDIIKRKKKNIMIFAYHQNKIVRKFKENNKFKSLIEQFKITKSTIMFKRNIVKLVDKIPKMMASSITINFLKSYYKHIKSIFQETIKFLNELKLFNRVYV